MVQSSAAAHSCTKCGKPTDNHFVFRYGKTVTDTTHQGVARRVISGEKEGYICDSCKRKEGRKRFASIFIALLVSIPICIAAVYAELYAAKDKDFDGALAFALVMAVLVTLITIPFLYIRKPAGCLALIDHYRKELAGMGYTVFLCGPATEETKSAVEKETRSAVESEHLSGQLFTDPIPEGHCHQCKKAGARTYSFYFGKRQSESVKRQGKYQTTTTTYTIGGSCSGEVCDSCIRCRMMFLFIVELLGSLSGLFITYLLFSNADDPKESLLYLVVITALFLVLLAFAIIKLLALIRCDYVEDGSRILMKADKGRYMDLGYDAFWTPAEFGRLKR